MSLSDNIAKPSPFSNLPEFQTQYLNNDSDSISNDIHTNFNQIMNILEPQKINFNGSNKIKNDNFDYFAEQETMARQNFQQIEKVDKPKPNSLREMDINAGRDLETLFLLTGKFCNNFQKINPNLSNLIKINVPFEEKFSNYIRLVYDYFKEFRYIPTDTISQLKAIHLLSAIMIQKSFQEQDNIKKDIAQLGKYLLEEMKKNKPVNQLLPSMMPNPNYDKDNVTKDVVTQLQEQINRLQTQINEMKSQNYINTSRMNQLTKEHINKQKIVSDINEKLRMKTEEMKNIIMNTLTLNKEEDSPMNGQDLSNNEYYSLDMRIKILEQTLKSFKSTQNGEIRTIYNSINQIRNNQNMQIDNPNSNLTEIRNNNTINIMTSKIEKLTQDLNKIKTDVTKINQNIDKDKQEAIDYANDRVNEIKGEMTDNAIKDFDKAQEIINKSNTELNNKISNLDKKRIEQEAKSLKDKSELEELINRNKEMISEKFINLEKIEIHQKKLDSLTKELNSKESKTIIKDKLKELESKYLARIETTTRENEDKLKEWTEDFNKRLENIENKKEIGDISELKRTVAQLKSNIILNQKEINKLNAFKNEEENKDKIDLNDIRVGLKEIDEIKNNFETLKTNDIKKIVQNMEILSKNLREINDNEYIKKIQNNINNLNKTMKDIQDEINKLKNDDILKKQLKDNTDNIDKINLELKNLDEKINNEAKFCKDNMTTYERNFNELKKENTKLIDKENVKSQFDSQTKTWEGKIKNLEIKLNNSIDMLKNSLNEENKKTLDFIEKYNDEQSKLSEKINLNDIKVSNLEKLKEQIKNNNDQIIKTDKRLEEEQKNNKEEIINFINETLNKQNINYQNNLREMKNQINDVSSLIIRNNELEKSKNELNDPNNDIKEENYSSSDILNEEYNINNENKYNINNENNKQIEKKEKDISDKKEKDIVDNFIFDIEHQNMNPEIWQQLNKELKEKFNEKRLKFRTLAMEKINKDPKLNQEEKERKLGLLDYFRTKCFVNNTLINVNRWKYYKNNNNNGRNFQYQQRRNSVKRKNQNQLQNQTNKVEEKLDTLINIMSSQISKQNMNFQRSNQIQNNYYRQNQNQSQNKQINTRNQNTYQNSYQNQNQNQFQNRNVNVNRMINNRNMNYIRNNQNQGSYQNQINYQNQRKNQNQFQNRYRSRSTNYRNQVNQNINQKNQNQIKNINNSQNQNQNQIYRKKFQNTNNNRNNNSNLNNNNF